ncbi:MAG: hypothetical protein H6643_00775 [Caldilineaceae bacterium]|nr:hypothetical protein [Caldilineaceae bacterium]
MNIIAAQTAGMVGADLENLVNGQPSWRGVTSAPSACRSS